MRSLLRARDGVWVALAVIVAACGAGRAPLAGTVRSSVALGAGLEPIVDWARTNVFVDLVKQSRGFGPPGTGDPATPIRLDANGWPLEDFAVILWTSSAAVHGLGGTYKLSCEGRATIAPLGSDAVIANVAYDSATNLTTADVVVKEGSDNLFLSFRGTTGGVRNLQIRRPGYAAGETFTTPFKNHLARFQALRFMDWETTNNNPVQRWSERSLPTDPRYSKGIGVPWEIVIQLGNELHKDLWINIPISADDGYVRELASLLKSTLDPSLHVYVEYSNEVWNFQFNQAQTNVDLAKAEVARGGSPLNADGETNVYYWGWRRVALRLKQMSDVFAAVYGRDAINTTVRMVLAGQSVNPTVLRQGLDLIQRTYGAPNQFFYAVAGAPYFTLGAVNDSTATLTVDDIIAALAKGVDDAAIVNAYEENATLARWFGLACLAYEGGPDTFGPNNVAAKMAAQWDPRMKDLIVRYLNGWYGYGFGLFNWFVAGATPYGTAYGTWGLTDDMSRLDTPKVNGIDAVLSSARPPLTGGSAIPGDIDARGYGGAPRPLAGPYLTGLGNGDFRDYLVRAPAEGDYGIELSAAAAWPGSSVRVLANGLPLATQSVPVTGGTNTFQYLPPITVHLTAGMNVIRLQVVNAGFNVKSLRVSAR